jgi:isoquinoline 1-oxidoreductase beta subunit
MLHDTHTLALSRRSFLVSTGAFSIAVAFGTRLDSAEAAAPFSPNAWVTIGEDGIVTIVAPMVEMGQGVRTSLPLILAEDLDADWSKVRVSETPDNDQIYGNPLFKVLFGSEQLQTVGSFSVTGYYEKLRLTGAQARKVLLVNAAAAWNVPIEELKTEPGIVVHAKSGRKISYGDIAKTATVPNPLPEVTKADLKPSSQFRLIGHDVGRVDVPLKVNGTAQYGIDVQIPGMLYAAILFPEVQYEKAEQIDDTAAKAIKGVLKIVPLPSGVGVIAETPEAAMKAKKLLKVTWSKSTPAQTYDDDRVLQDYRAIAADWSQTGVPMVTKGDADAAVKGAAKVLTADFFSDHVSHVCMEPLNVTVRVDNGVIDVWSGNQAPTVMKIPVHGHWQDHARQGAYPHPTTGRRLRPAHRRRRPDHGFDPGAQYARQTGENDLEPRGRHPQRQAAAVDRAADRDRSRRQQRHRRLAAAHRQRILFRPHYAAGCMGEGQSRYRVGRRR